MTEGPGVRFNYLRLSKLIGKKVVKANGQRIIKGLPFSKLNGKELKGVLSIGKQFYFVIGDFLIRVQFLMNGMMAIGYKRSKKSLRLELDFGPDEKIIRFYSCTVSLADPEQTINYINELKNRDPLGHSFEPKLVIESLDNSRNICDLLVDQKIFPGVGNIIKCEALYKAGISPYHKGSDLSLKQRKLLVEKTKEFSEAWYDNKKKGYRNWTLRKFVYGRKYCDDGTPIKVDYIGTNKRITYWCPSVQK